MSIPERFRGRFFPRDPINEPRPRPAFPEPPPDIDAPFRETAPALTANGTLSKTHWPGSTEPNEVAGMTGALVKWRHPQTGEAFTFQDVRPGASDSHARAQTARHPPVTPRSRRPRSTSRSAALVLGLNRD